jgi:hypothetical protein
MIIIIFLVCVAILVIGARIYNRCDEVAGGFTMFFGIAGGVISVIALIVLLINVSTLKVIDEEIEMYQEENTRIENQISDCVKQYQQYESEIFIETSTESAITLVSLYPELKADTLVAKQIEVYISNNEKIKELKGKKIKGNVYRWWAYFGGNNNAE